MNRLSNGWLSLVLALAWAVTPAAFAQTATTGALSGIVTDESGGVLPGANVEATHEPTGTRYSAVTGSDGRYSILNVRVGPYTVSVSMSGFKPLKQTGVPVALGEERSFPFKLKLETMTETVEVIAESGIISGSNTGPASNVAQEAIESLPTIARGIEDFARLSPYFNSSGGGDGAGANALSVAGRNSRYNNVQIDGAVNNDLFGLADSGTPGGQTEMQPISIEAIQELQLVVAPGDVRQGGFSGGGLNAITKSGTNAFKGSVYFFNRNETLVGDGPNQRPIATFGQKQMGATLGGPLLKDKLFFFVNGDFGRKDTPSGFSADGASGQNFSAGRQAEVDRFLDILQRRYGYNPGSKAEFIRANDNNKYLMRLDYNLNTKNRLTLRHNFPTGDADIGFPSTRLYLFPDRFYHIHNKQNSTVAQLNSTIGRAVNELRVTYQSVNDLRDGPTRFPMVTVDISGGGQLVAGRENFSTANELDQKVLEINDDYTFHKGDHLISLGTHNEFFSFRNLFIRDNYGSYRFASLDLFEQGVAQSYDNSFSATSDPRQAARFKVQQLGFYAGDLWRVTNRLTLNFGARLDIPHFPEKPTANPQALAIFGFATDVVPAPKLFSPRAFFNWNIDGTAKQQLRGGVGLFSGRTPYVWLSNQYGNTGIEFTRIGASFNANNRIPFVTNPDGQPRVVTGAAAGSFTNEVDVVDPDYKFPQVLRTSLGYDRDLGLWGLIGTIEGFYSRNVKDIAYANLNFVQTGSRPDGRPVFGRRNTAFSDVVLLKNTGEGYQYVVATKVERPFRNGWFAMASYSYGDSKSINDGTSSQAASNWGNASTKGDPNNVDMGRSRFSPGHRVMAAVSRDWRLGKRANLLLSAFYNGQSGRVYHFAYNGDFNGDARFSNDIMYVPAVNDPKVVFTNGTAQDWESYVANDKGLQKFRGQIMERGASRAPFTNVMDVKALFGVPVQRFKLEVGIDVLNFLNMLNKDWGVVDYPTFNDLNPIAAPTINAAGQMVYNLVNITSPTYVKFDRDDLRSRWQGQLSFRLRF